MTRRALQRPGLVLGVWAAAVLVLGIQAAFVSQRLSQPSYTIDGTGSQRALALDERTFGNDIEFPVLLRGPAAELNRQGPAISARLDRTPGVSVLSPWGLRHSALRPAPGVAMVVARVTGRPEDAFDAATTLRRIVRSAVRPPLRASITGQALIGKSLEERTLSATDTAELIALPILLVVLLVVFRSPVAAAVPAVFGVATVVAAFGTISLLALILPLEATAVSLASMMGLALGVDYSLLLVSRFRDELGDAAGRADARRAARVAVNTAGRTAAFAGGTLALAMAAALVLSPGTMLLSAILGVIIVAGLSVLGAVLVVPAALTLIGQHINRWPIGIRSGRAGGLARAGTRRMLRRPAPAALAVLVVVGALGAPALAIKPRTPGVDLLPRDDRARVDYDAISRALGPGWGAPFQVSLAVNDGTVTEPRRLAQIAALEHAIARDPDVATVLGPGQLLTQSRRLRSIPGQLTRLRRAQRSGTRQLERLAGGLRSAHRGADSLLHGVGQAADASERLHAGSQSAARGSGKVVAGLESAAGGARTLANGLGTTRHGADRLTHGSARAADGADRLAGGLGRLRHAATHAMPALATLAAQLKQGADGLEQLKTPAGLAARRLGDAFTALSQMTAGRLDPRYRDAITAVGEADAAVTGRDPTNGQPVQAGYDGLEAALGQAADGGRSASRAGGTLRAKTTRIVSALARLQHGARKLQRGLGRLGRGDAAVSRALDQAQTAAGQGGQGLARLVEGGQSLQDGLQRITAGDGRLATGLAAGHDRAQPLDNGLQRAARRTSHARASIPSAKGLGGITRQSPGLFRSGHLLLAAVDGAPPATRRQAASVIDVDRGGRGARIFVIPRTGATADRTAALRDRLARMVEAFGARTHMEAELGGEAALLVDYDREISAVLPVLIVALALVTWVALVVVVRALLLPLIAVMLNLLTVAAAFGVLVLLYQGSAPLGGPGYLDAIAVIGIFGIVFGLSIDYEVFLIGRMHEEYVRTASPEAAIEQGLLRTAGVITGAAAIMIGVFVAFALAPFVAIAEFGVGLTVAVLLDATLVRLVLLPALTRLCGASAWWLPEWLDRLLDRRSLSSP